MVKQPEEDSRRRRQPDLLRQLLPDWSLRPALRVGRQLEVVPQLRVGLAAAVAAPVANLWQEAAGLRLPDSPAPEPRDSYHRLPAALVPEAELARAKPTRTRLQRDR